MWQGHRRLRVFSPVHQLHRVLGQPGEEVGVQRVGGVRVRKELARGAAKISERGADVQPLPVG